MTSRYGRLGGVSVLVAAAAIGLAACSSGSSSPQVASLGGSNTPSVSSGGSSASGPAGNPTQLVDGWASCMRSHGFPTLADPTIDANKVIHVTIPPGITGNAGNIYRQSSAFAPCNPYLVAASKALRGNVPPPSLNPVVLQKFAQCMRANGISDYPDIGPNGQVVSTPSPGKDLSTLNPTFNKARQTCATQVGFPPLSGAPQAGSVQVTRGAANG